MTTSLPCIPMPQGGVCVPHYVNTPKEFEIERRPCVISEDLLFTLNTGFDAGVIVEQSFEEYSIDVFLPFQKTGCEVDEFYEIINEYPSQAIRLNKTTITPSDPLLRITLIPMRDFLTNNPSLTPNDYPSGCQNIYLTYNGCCQGIRITTRIKICIRHRHHWNWNFHGPGTQYTNFIDYLNPVTTISRIDSIPWTINLPPDHYLFYATFTTTCGNTHKMIGVIRRLRDSNGNFTNSLDVSGINLLDGTIYTTVNLPDASGYTHLDFTLFVINSGLFNTMMNLPAGPMYGNGTFPFYAYLPVINGNVYYIYDHGETRCCRHFGITENNFISDAPNNFASSGFWATRSTNAGIYISQQRLVCCDTPCP